MGTSAQVASQQTQPASGVILSPRHHKPWRGYLFIALLICCVSGNATADSAADLLDQYQQLQHSLTHNPFNAPIALRSTVEKREVKGEVFAILDFPLARLQRMFTQPAQWCALAFLHVNIKACIYHQDQLRFYAGRKYYQTPDQAYPLQYHFALGANRADYLDVQLSAPEGPFDTSDYFIQLEATALDTQRSFIRFEYRYRFGWMAKFSMEAYLATMGSHRVGFTVTGTDEEGKPVYVKGMQGVIERNVMHYLLAIQSLLETADVTGIERQLAQETHWYAHIAQYPQQLVELTREEYLDNKRRESANQEELQQSWQGETID